MNKSRKQFSQTRSSVQKGAFSLLHALLIVAIVVGIAVLHKKGMLPYLQYRPDLTGLKRALAPVDQSSYYRGQYSSSNHESQRYSDEKDTFDDYRPASNSRSRPAVERKSEDSDYMHVRYAVQCAAGYDSRQLYELRDALIRDGYNAYLVSLSSSQGMMFKLRVGAYNRRAQADALRETLARRYPQSLGNSFVVSGE